MLHSLWFCLCKIALIVVVWQTKCCSSWFLVLWFGSAVINPSWLAIGTDSRTFRCDGAADSSLLIKILMILYRKEICLWLFYIGK